MSTLSWHFDDERPVQTAAVLIDLVQPARRRSLEHCRTNPLVFRRVLGAFGDGLFAAVRESGPVVPRIVGRDGELAVVRDVLDGVGDGPATLALWGDTGIGKSTIWEAAVAQARRRGFTVLASRPAAPEVHLSYAGLADLLADVDAEVVAGLPVPQQRALDAALLRGFEDEATADPRAVAAGLQSVINVVAAAGPIVVAIDDLQWLDEPTRRVLAFAIRRCHGPMVMLSAERAEWEPGARIALWPADPGRLRDLNVPPLSLGALHEVLRERTGRSFARPMMVRIAELSGGNPFFALEVARSLAAHPVGPSVLPASLRQLVCDRFASLGPTVRDALLVAAAVADPRLEIVAKACGQVDVADLLGPAEDAGVVELTDGRVRFTHPLLASGFYREASPGRRRSLHRRLADLVSGVEERGRHRALAATGPEPDVVAALEAAAAHARRRGAASAAAELLELAIGLGAGDPGRRSRAARDHFHAGDLPRARELLESAVASLDAGPQRAEALGLLGTVLYAGEGYDRAVEVLERAFGEADADGRLRCSIALELCMALPNAGRLPSALEYASIAIAEAEAADDDGLLAEALAQFVTIHFLLGDGVDQASLERALGLEDPQRSSHAVLWPSLNAAMVHLWSHQLDQARGDLAALHERCLVRGAESDLWFVLAYATVAALWSGDVVSAERLAAEMTERARMIGSQPVAALALTVQATVDAWRGRVDEARANAEASMAGLARSQFGAGWLFALGAWGMAELSVGRHAVAVGWLAAAAEDLVQTGVGEPSVAPFLPDAAEALIAVGRLDEAEGLVERLEASGRRAGRTWADAVGARCRGLLFGATGELDQAMAAFGRALAAHNQLPLRYDKARTLLVLGQLQRRRHERRAAKASLEEAAELFEDVGATRWAATARAECERLGLRPGPSDRLTPSEERVASLAAAGMTNREVAARLLVSPKTVEANLSRAYRKLGVHSRAELGGWFAQRSDGMQPTT